MDSGDMDVDMDIDLGPLDGGDDTQFVSWQGLNWIYLGQLTLLFR